MSIVSFVSDLRKQKIRIWVDGSNLRVKAPSGKLTPAIKKELAQQKDALIRFLRRTQKTKESGPTEQEKVREAPITHHQRRLWLIERMGVDAPAFQKTLCYRILGPLDRKRLAKALSSVIRRHDVLRARVGVKDGSPFMLYPEKGNVSLKVDNISSLSVENKNQEISRIITHEAHASFDIEAGPLMRAKVIRVNENQHYLVLAFHDLVADHTSLDIFIAEVSRAFEKPGGEIDALAHQFDHFAQKEEQQLQDGAFDNSIEFWKDHLAEASSPLRLFGSHKHPAVQSFKGRSVGLHFSPDTSQALANLGQSLDLPAENVLLSCLYAFLFRYTGETQIPVAIYEERRQGSAHDDLIGPFATRLPLCVSINKETSFNNVLVLVQKILADGMQYKQAPTELVAAELSREGLIAHRALAQVAFQKKIEAPILYLPELTAESIPVETETNGFDLLVSAHCDPGAWSIELNCSSSLFDEEQIERMRNHLQHLVEEIVADPSQSISGIQVMSSEEVKQQLAQWNQDKKGAAQISTLHQLFEQQVENTPEALAVKCGDKELSYRELNDKANDLAWTLLEAGVRSEDCVAILFSDSMIRLVSVLATLKTGGAYLPLSPDFPEERISYILNDCTASFVITESSLAENLPKKMSAKTIVISLEEIKPLGKGNPSRDISPCQLAYVGYIPVSRALPKGVMHEHDSICNGLTWMKTSVPLSNNDKVLQKAPFTFNIFIWETFWPLISGASLVLAERDIRDDSLYMARIIQQESVTAVHLNPHDLALLVDGPYSRVKKPSLTCVLCSDAILTESLKHRFFQAYQGISLHHLYGPFEMAVYATEFNCNSPVTGEHIPLGRPISQTQVYVLDEEARPAPVFHPGQICISGDSLARGYLNDCRLSAAKFTPNPHSEKPGDVLYNTGDLGYFLPSGDLVYLGRIDQRFSLDGLHVDPGEIENILSDLDEVSEARIRMHEDLTGSKYLVAYVVSSENFTDDDSALRKQLEDKLPIKMIPDFFVSLSSFPRLKDNQIDLASLPVPRELQAKSNLNLPRSHGEVERILSQIWRDVLGLPQVGFHDRFFDLGGSSLDMLKVYNALPSFLKRDLTLVDLFRYPTIHELDFYLEKKQEEDVFRSPREEAQEDEPTDNQAQLESVAVIGISCRLPGANNVSDFWENIRQGRKCITFFSKDDLAKEGVPDEMVDDPDYVRAQGVIHDVKMFDAGFFDMTPREVQVTDPQHRLFIECSWEALEDAGYCQEKYDQEIGVFGSCYVNTYLKEHLTPNQRLWDTVGELPIMIGNDRDSLCTKAAFKLGLRGPAVTIQSACSSSLVALHTACRAVLVGDCGIALAGASSLGLLRRVGYLYEEGLLCSPDGNVRSFDEKAKGVVPGQGTVILALKKMSAALADGDRIYAKIKGSAINNDGSAKDGFTTYSAEGQAHVIRKAWKMAGIDPLSISYVESSSTGSTLGDKTEIAGLTKAYEEITDRKNFIPIGALKPNIGGLDTASGIAALLKVILMLKNHEIPPVANFKKSNPQVPFGDSPVFVNEKLRPWDHPDEHPRLAAVSAFGLGGTNAHIILEEHKENRKSTQSRSWELLTLSAKTDTALDALTNQLAHYLGKNPAASLSDVAYTLQIGRRHFAHRRVLVAESIPEAVIDLVNNSHRVLSNHHVPVQRKVAFMFPGQGSQYMNMGEQLYRTEPVYRELVDQCWDMVRDRFPEFYEDLSERDRRGRTARIHQTNITQLSLFIVEYSLAKLLMHWGIKPDAMIGNSTGEYVAAAIAEVFSLEDAIRMVIKRGQAMRDLPPGSMLFVVLSEEELLPRLNDKLSIAGVAAPNLCIVSGTREGISALRQSLTEEGIGCRRSFAPHAFHSFMVDPVVPIFAKMIEHVQFNPPKIPLISSVTGTWLTQEEATDHMYWARQLRRTVRFQQGVEVLLQEPHRVLLEVGPDKSLSAPALQSSAKTRGHLILGTMRHPQEEESDLHHLFQTLGRLWLVGVEIDWEAVHTGRRRLRTGLPFYPFERAPHWIDPPEKKGTSLELESDELLLDHFDDDEHFRPNVGSNYAAPRDPVEQTIAATWSEYLGLEVVGIHDDFFELGGNSLIAVRLLADLGKQLNVPLATHVLLQKRTVASLAEVVKESTANPDALNSDSPIVQIQLGHPKVNPLFMVHPIGGEIFWYVAITKYLGRNQPLYGFQAPSLVGKSEPFTGMEEQAAAYVAALRKFKPKGPYILGGASYGGNVAYEMAQQLIAAGEDVPLLVIVDSPAPGAMPSKFSDSAAILYYLLEDKLPISVERLRELEPEEQMNYIMEEARMSGRTDALPPTLGIPMFKTWMGHQKAMHEYKPKDYPGRVIFFRPTEMMKVNPPNMHVPWIDMVKGGIEIHQTPGTHVTMLQEPHVPVLAKHLRKALRDVSKRG